MNTSEKLAIVLLNWNGKALLSKFLPNLVRHSQPYTIILADNASTDDSISYVQTFYPQIQIIKNQFNSGFAQGYNEALSHIEGQYDYYLLLNTDVEVTKNWIAPLLQTIQKNSEVAGVQPKVKSFYHRTHFEHAGAAGGFMDRHYYPFCRGRMFNTVEHDQGQYDNEKAVFWTSGACMLVKSTVFHELNGFDGDFFAHMEEIDFCWRAKKMGYCFYVNPASTVYHVGGGTLDYANPRKTFLNFRNSLYMIHKNHEGRLAPKIFSRLVLDGIAGVHFLLSANPKNTWAIIKAHFSYYKALPTLRTKRKNIQQKATSKGPLQDVFQGSLLFNYFIKGNRYFTLLNKRKFN